MYKIQIDFLFLHRNSYSMNTKTDWFSTWFDTPYYHLLYNYRNDTEAQLFMQNLIKYLALKKDSIILDLACGKGRHSIYLNSLGYEVRGVDLAKNSIDFAKKFENESLKFKVHDMRNPKTQQYDTIFNLFTSFGYFEEDSEDICVLQNIKDALKPNGVAVIDFLNVKKALKNLVAEEIQQRDAITFNIKRSVKDGFIIKEILFRADGQDHQYFERVKCLTLTKIKKYLDQVGLTLVDHFGDYNLEKFDVENSNRLILVVK